MTCSSNTISSTEARWRRILALTLAIVGLAGLGVPINADAGKSAGKLILEARRDIAQGEAVAAEVKLQEALDMGVSRRSVAAYMGEAALLRGDFDRARFWLEGRAFAPVSAARGFRALGRLEQRSGNLPASGRAFDEAIKLTPNDPEMWVEIGHLRFAGGEDLLAIDASDYAIALDPENARALEFRAEIVRDRDGLRKSLPWFEKALKREPNDVSTLLEYAATLGELGHAKDMLRITRRVLKLDPGNPKAFYLQSIMAARAGYYTLARRLMQRTEEQLSGVPGAMLLEGILEMKAGNYGLATEALERLLKFRPDNEHALLLLARALYLSGEHRYLASRFSKIAGEPDAPVYLQVQLARSYETADRRDLAAPLLEKASRVRADRVRIRPRYDEIGALLSNGKIEAAKEVALRRLEANPGNYESLTTAGDIAWLQGKPSEAVAFYLRAAKIRMPESLLSRSVQAMFMAGKQREALDLLSEYLKNNPTSREALLIAGRLAGNAGDWNRARQINAYLGKTGSGSDVQLLADLSLAQLRTGQIVAAAATAEQAYRIQRSSPVATQIWGLSLAIEGMEPAKSAGLLKKATTLAGDTALTIEGRRRLAALASR